MPKTDTEQLKGILEEFDKETLHSVLRELNIKPGDLRRAIVKKTKDFPQVNRKKKSKVGDRNHLSKEAYVAAKPFNERVIGLPDFKPVHFLECGWERQKPVARMNVGSWFGTGFLVSRSLIMTNNHVIPSVASGRIANAEFNYQTDHEGNMLSMDSWDGDPDNFFHTDVNLDYTVMRLKGRTSFRFVQPKPYVPYLRTPYIGPKLPLPIPRPPISGPDTPRMPETMEGLTDIIALVVNRLVSAWGPVGPVTAFLTKHAGDTWGFIPLQDTVMTVGARLNIIQHPAMRPKEVAMHSNELTHMLTDAIHYTTDTEGGSSGSPVFDNSWDLIALHHAAGDWNSATSSWIDNEGMRIDRIIDDLQANLRGTSEAHILDELGIL